MVCFEESRARGIGVHPLIFNDNKGSWKCNLWYSEMSTQINHLKVYKNREELLQDCADFFILLRDKDTTSTLLRTMVCRSWRVRDDGGKIRLPLPLKNVLLMKQLIMTAVISALSYGLLVLLFTYHDDVLPKYITRVKFFLKVIFIANPHTHPPPSPHTPTAHAPLRLSLPQHSPRTHPLHIHLSKNLFATAIKQHCYHTTPQPDILFLI